MKKIKLTVPVPPSDNRYYSIGVKRKSNGMPYGQRYISKEGKDFKKEVFHESLKIKIPKEWKASKIPKFCLLIDVYFKDKRPDLTNVTKALCDALTDCVIYDDKQIQSVYMNRMIEDKENPRLELTLIEIKDESFSRSLRFYVHDFFERVTSKIYSKNKSAES